MRKSIVLVAIIFSVALALQALLGRHAPGRALEWIPLAFVAVALRIGTRLLSRRNRAPAASQAVAPIRLKA